MAYTEYASPNGIRDALNLTFSPCHPSLFFTVLSIFGNFFPAISQRKNKNSHFQLLVSGCFYCGAEGQNRTADTGIFSAKMTIMKNPTVSTNYLIP